MINKLKPKSEFSRNVVTLMTGTTIAQAIPIAISPILTRIYTPEDFGIFALYMSLLTIISVIATGKYELAIMLPDEENDALNLVSLSILISSTISLFSLIIVFFFNKNISTLFNNQDISTWLYFLPITVFIMGIYNSLNYWYSRNKDYKPLSKSVVYRSFFTSISNISLGFMKFGGGGMILGQFLGQLIATISLIRNINIKHIVSNTNRKSLLFVMKRYIDFPKITAIHAVFNSLTQSIPIFIITYYFSIKEAGLFSFAGRVVMLPISLISNSYYQVFFQAFSK
jgi:O-antigen/teichoic acid export membrane protein